MPQMIIYKLPQLTSVQLAKPPQLRGRRINTFLGETEAPSTVLDFKAGAHGNVRKSITKD
jgi:hypothetical protein